MKILVFSDTHQKINGCVEILQQTKDVGAVLHAGDLVQDAEDLAAAFPAIPFYFVSGNNDLFSSCPEERTLTFEGVTLLLTHGHLQNVRFGLRELANHAKRQGAALAVFGHTHEAFLGTVSGVQMLNPGSMGYAPKSYGVLTIENGQIQTNLVSVR